MLGLCSLWALWVSPSQAQNYTLDQVHPGTLILSNADTLTGPILINLAQDAVQLTYSEGVVKTWSARQIERFFIEDRDNNMKRFFYSFPYGRSYKRPTLFELLVSGRKLSLLARESLTYETVPMYDAFSTRYMTTRTRIAYDFFFQDEQGNISPYSMRKKDLLALLSDREKQIKDFLKEQDLGTTERRDLIAIITYYNTLFELPSSQPTYEKNISTPADSSLKR